MEEAGFETVVQELFQEPEAEVGWLFCSVATTAAHHPRWIWVTSAPGEKLAVGAQERSLVAEEVVPVSQGALRREVSPWAHLCPTARRQNWNLHSQAHWSEERREEDELCLISGPSLLAHRKRCTYNQLAQGAVRAALQEQAARHQGSPMGLDSC